ncbi:hypothetical protein LTR86_010655 [Recurvomyces mirabilis]|nr:hypothetical protein LTR86_010655 [Recurvomyces mirabilis]
MADKEKLETRVRELQQILIATTQELAVAQSAIMQCENTIQAIKGSFRSASTTPETTTRLRARNDSITTGMSDVTRKQQAQTIDASLVNDAHPPQSEPNEDLETGASQMADPVREQQPAGEIIVTNPGERPEVVHERYQIVVRIVSTWAEISCQYCGCNALITGAKFYKGAPGLHSHVLSSHADQIPGSYWFADTMSGCSKRTVSSRDVAEMKEGRDPVDVEIVKRSLQPKGKGRRKSTMITQVPRTDTDQESAFDQGSRAKKATPTHQNSPTVSASSLKTSLPMSCKDEESVDFDHGYEVEPNPKRQRIKIESEREIHGSSAPGELCCTEVRKDSSSV